MKKITLIALSIILLWGCKKDEKLNPNSSFPEYFNNKSILQIIKKDRKITFLSVRICSECVIPLWQSYIPSKFQISELDNEFFKTTGDIIEISKLISYKNEKYLTTSRNKLLLFNELNGFDTLYKNLLPISSFAADAEDNFWIGTYENGFTKVSKYDTINYNTNSSSLPTNEIHEIAINKQTNEKWFVLGSPCYKLLRIDNSNWTYFDIKEITGADYVYFTKMLFDNSNNLWVLGKTDSNSNILKFNGNNWENIKPTIDGVEIDCFATNIFIEENDDLWIINKNKEILHYNGNFWKKIALQDNNCSIICLLNSDNQLFIGTNNGITIIKHE